MGRIDEPHTRRPRFSNALGVLIIDDDVMVRTMAITLLAHMGARAEGVAGSADAIAALSRASAQGRPLNVVLLDLHLGDEGGADLCRQLRTQGVDVPIIAMSGDTYSPESLRKIGFSDFIAKPFAAADLHSCLERHAKGEGYEPRR